MAARKQPSAVPQWRTRIQELRYCLPSELADHPLQWRVHPHNQAAAMRGILDEVGIAGAGLAYVSEATGLLTSIDGHMRKALDPAMPWPTLILDLTDAEAALLLATYDPLAGLASANASGLAALLQTVSTGEAALQAMLGNLAEEHGLFPAAPPSLADLEQQYGTDTDGFLKTITVKVPPAVFDAYHALLRTMDGATEAEQFAALLGAYGDLPG